MKTYEVTPAGFVLRFRLENPTEWRETLDAVKTLRGRIFDSKQKVWRCPLIEENETQIKALGFVLVGGGDAVPVEYSEPTPTPEPEETEWTPPWRDVPVETKGATYLWPYQVEALRFLRHLGGRGLIGDDMGTGKTVMACGWAATNPEEKTILVVCTATTKLQWAAALMKFGAVSPATERTLWGLQLAKPLLLHGKTPRAIPPRTQAIVCNWDILPNWLPVLLELPLAIFIADECQAMGNPKSLRTKAAMKLAKAARSFVPMSGTPMRTRPAQFWPVLSLLDPENFGNLKRFLYRYCGPKHNGFTMEFKGASNLPELHKKVRRIMLRREIADVQQDMPKKIISVVPVEADLSMYQAEAQEFYTLAAGGDADMAELRQRLTNLGRTAYLAKEQGVLDWLRGWLDESDHEQIVVFAWHRAVVEKLLTELADYGVARIFGGMTATEKESEKARFVGRRARVMVANILAAGVGLDGLQETCANTAFVEFAASPEDHKQAEARLYRAGQTRPVFCHYLIAPKTVDEDCVEALDARRATFSAILDGKDTSDLDFLGELLARQGVVRGSS